MAPEDAPPPSWKVSSMLLERVKGNLIAPERMKRLIQSRNDAQLWICLIVKVKFSALKNNQGKVGNVGKREHRHLKNQWTKIDVNGWI